MWDHCDYVSVQRAVCADGCKSIVWHTAPVDVMRRCFADAVLRCGSYEFREKGENSPTAFFGSGTCTSRNWISVRGYEEALRFHFAGLSLYVRKGYVCCLPAYRKRTREDRWSIRDFFGVTGCKLYDDNISLRYNWHINILTTFKHYRELIIQRTCNLVKFARNLKGLYIYVYGCGDAFIYNRLHFSRLSLCNVFIIG